MSEAEERPARRWELTNAENRIKALEDRDKREDNSRRILMVAVFVAVLNILSALVISALTSYLLRGPK